MLSATFLQIGFFFKVIDPYEYDKTIADPSAVLDMFTDGNVERQGQMFEDYVFDDLSKDDVRRFFLVQDHVWNR